MTVGASFVSQASDDGLQLSLAGARADGEGGGLIRCTGIWDQRATTSLVPPWN